MNYCKTCGEYMHAGRTHECEPAWQCDIDGDGWGDIHAGGPSAAAEKAAEKWWENDYPDSGDTCTVAVKVGDSVHVYEVTADWSLDASAKLQDVEAGT